MANGYLHARQQSSEKKNNQTLKQTKGSFFTALFSYQRLPLPYEKVPPHCY